VAANGGRPTLKHEKKNIPASAENVEWSSKTRRSMFHHGGAVSILTRFFGLWAAVDTLAGVSPSGLRLRRCGNALLTLSSQRVALPL